MENEQAQEAPQPISDERIAAAQERIGELCREAFKQGYERGHGVGYGLGFEAGVNAATGQDNKKITLA